MDEEEEWPETWDRNKVYMYTDPTGIKVPVPIGFTASSAESEKYVTGNVEVKGNLSNLTFTSTGDYPWTLNNDNIWVSGNKEIADSVSELVSNEFTVGANGGWVEVEWSVCSESRYDLLSMEINDTANGTSEQMPKTISGTLYGTAESSLIYTKCGKELSQGTYSISIKYTKNNNTTHTGLDSGYVKSGKFIDYDESGADTLDIHKAGGFVIYEGNGEITDANAYEESKNRNQFVWIPSSTGISTAVVWISRDNIGNFSKNDLQGYDRYTFYKEMKNDLINADASIRKYGGFYLGRYETGNLNQSTTVVRRLNSDIGGITWYKMYKRVKNISNNTNIQLNMVSTSIWNIALNWLISTGDKVYNEVYADSMSWGNYNNISISGVYDNLRKPTGSNEKWKSNNIYDLAGNVWEWVIDSTNRSDYPGRSMRGGSYITGLHVAYNAWNFRVYQRNGSFSFTGSTVGAQHQLRYTSIFHNSLIDIGYGNTIKLMIYKIKTSTLWNTSQKSP